jgi:phosphatidylinositol alpha-1,6-mannosyltransferase
MGKILLFTTDFPPSKGGGICTHSNFMVETLKNYGWEFMVLSEYYIDSSQEAIEEYSKEIASPIYKLPKSTNKFSLIKKIFYCYKKYRDFRPDIIIGTGRHPTWYAAFISKLTRTPLVTIGHGTEFTQVTSKYDLKVNKWAYSHSKLLICISKFTRESAIKVGINPKSFCIINNAADNNFFTKINEEEIKSFKKRKNLSDKKVILTIGSVYERKGQRVIIEAMPDIIKYDESVIYVSIGYPLMKKEYSELAIKLEVIDKIYFEGIINEKELLLWLNACDLFAMTSIGVNGDFEGYGIAVIEAAFCGKTSVVSDNGGLKEAVRHNQTGIVVSENNINETANAIIDLFKDKDKLEKLSNSAFTNALENNTWQVVGEKYNSELIKLLK